MKLCTLKRRRGFTLIEVVIAAVTFTVVVAGTVGSVRLLLDQGTHQRYASAALALLETVSEDLVLVASSHSDLDEGDHERTYGFDGVPDPYGAFSARWTVVGNAPIDGMRTLSIEVAWDERGTERSLALRTVRQ